MLNHFHSSVLTRILNRVRKWEEMGKMRSFVKQTEIRLGLDESYRELRTCSMRFNVRCAHSLFFLSDYSLQYGAVPPTDSISRVCVDRSAFGCKPSE